MCREIKVHNINASYMHCVDEIKEGWLDPRKDGFSIHEFMRFKDYISELEWVVCYGLFMRGEYSRNNIADGIHELFIKL